MCIFVLLIYGVDGFRKFCVVIFVYVICVDLDEVEFVFFDEEGCFLDFVKVFFFEIWVSSGGEIFVSVRICILVLGCEFRMLYILE